MKDNIFSSNLIITFLVVLAVAASSTIEAQSFCCARNCENGDFTGFVCDDYPDTYGPFYVKVYLYFVVPPNAPNAFSDPLEVRSAEIWAKWREAYSPHRIYFVLGFGGCDPATKFDTIESDIEEASMDDVEDLRDLGYKHNDGIDVYIFRDDSPLVGNSFCIPNNYYFLGGTELIAGTVTVILSKTQLVSHEQCGEENSSVKPPYHRRRSRKGFIFWKLVPVVK